MDRWLFLHVLKTAGTSFRAMIEETLGAVLYPTNRAIKAQPNGWCFGADEPFRRIDDGRLDRFRPVRISRAFGDRFAAAAGRPGA